MLIITNELIGGGLYFRQITCTLEDVSLPYYGLATSPVWYTMVPLCRRSLRFTHSCILKRNGTNHVQRAMRLALFLADERTGLSQVLLMFSHTVFLCRHNRRVGGMIAMELEQEHMIL